MQSSATVHWRTAALAERRQHVADVVEERLVRPDDEHAVASEPTPMLEQQVRRTVQRDGGLAGAGATLDDQHLVDVGADHDVLLGLDRRHDLAHLARSVGTDLGEYRVRDAAHHVGRVRIVEVLVEVGEISPSSRVKRRRKTTPSGSTAVAR